MALPDRGQNVLHRLMQESELASGNIVFVGYSYGGLVVKSALREAERIASVNARADSLLARIRRIMFLSTPHLGSDSASIVNRLSLLLRPTAITKGLSSEDPDLRNLNDWFRTFVSSRAIDVQVQRESLPLKVFGLTVKPSSADPGVAGATVIAVDEDHFTIASPRDRNSEVYLHLKSFVMQPFDLTKLPTMREALDTFNSGLQLIQSTAEEFKAESEKRSARLTSLKVHERGNPVVTAAAEEQLQKLRKLRHLQGFDATLELPPFIESLTDGVFASSTDELKQRALAWGARLLSASDETAARSALLAARRYGTSHELELAEAFLVLFAENNKSRALELAARIHSPLAKSALLMIGTNGLAFKDAAIWAGSAGLRSQDLDAEGKAQLLRIKLLSRDWDGALSDASDLTPAEYSCSSTLAFYSAYAHIVQVFHPELRPGIISSLPTEVGNLPLSSDLVAITFREKAEELFEIAAKEIFKVGGKAEGEIASDFSLWLRLRHPSRKADALKQLERSMSDPLLRLRRLPIALSTGLKIDIAAAEREIEEEAIRSGGKSVAAAVARLALAEHRNQPVETARC